MTFKKLVLTCMVLACFHLMLFSQRTTIDIYIFKLHFEGFSTTDADLVDALERNYTNAFRIKLKDFPDCLDFVPSQEIQNSRTIHFEGQIQKLKRYGIESDKLVVPILSDAILVAKFKYVDVGFYIEMEIVTVEGISACFSSITEKVTKDELRIENQVYFQKLLQEAINKKEIIKLMNKVLNNDGTGLVDFDCNRSQIPPVPDFIWEPSKKQRAPISITFLDRSENTKSIEWKVERKLFLLPPVNMDIPQGNIDNYNLRQDFKRGGKYNITLTARGYNGEERFKKEILKLNWRKMKPKQKMLIGAGGFILAGALTSKLISNDQYGKYKLGTTQDREVVYSKANTLHQVSVVSLYTGSAFILGGLLWYRFEF